MVDSTVWDANQARMDQGMDQLDSRRKLVTVGLIVYAVLAFLSAGTSLLELLELVDYEAAELSPLSAAATVIVVTSVLVLLVDMVLVAIWIHRAHANLRDAGYDKQFTPGWAVGWFFVPFANLVMPFRAMRELWNLSHLQADSIDSPPSILTQWWGLWLVGNIGSNIGVRLSSHGISTGYVVDAVSAIVTAASAILLYKIVTLVTDSQRSVVGAAEAFA
jgi:hypothetical protein